MWKDLLGEKLIGKSGDLQTEDALKDADVVGIYFSGHWCPPCRNFTPKFAESYNKLREAGKKFEVVFVSSDHDEAAFTSYHSEQPWMALPYDQRETKDKLSKKYGCSGIPYLVILDKEGEVITKNGRAGVSGPNFIADFPYHPKPMYDASESMDGIEGGISFMLVQNYTDEETRNANSAILLDIATNQKDLFHKFFTVNNNEGPTQFVRTQTGMKFYSAKPNVEMKLIKSSEAPYKDYGCDRCGGYKTCDERMMNVEEQRDICLPCWEKPWESATDADKIPTMVAIDLPCNEYIKPVEGNEAFSKENVEKFAKDIKDKTAKRIGLGKTE